MSAVRRLEADGADELVERETELRLLTRLIGDLEHGHGGSAAVLGPAGSGRTALLDQVASLAAGRGLQVFTARGSATEAQLPYGLLSQLLAPIPELADVPWLHAALSDGTDAQVLHELLCQRLLESARRCPVLLVVDDLALVDEQSEAWLAALQRRRGNDPVLLVAAHSGPEDADEADPLSLGGLPWENRHVVRLRPLSEAAVRRLVHAVPAPRPPVAEVYAATRGNPALLAEVLARSSAGPEITAVTADVRRDTVLDLLARLPSDLAALVRTIAAIGTLDEAYLRPLAGPLGMPLGRALRVLADAGLIGTDPVEPMNPQVATWVLAETGADERAGTRRRAAELGHRRAAPEEDVAGLLLGSQPVGEAWALETLHAAALRRREAGDHTEAARYYRRALAEPAPPGMSARLRLELETVEASSCPFTGGLRLARATRVSGDDTVRTRLSAVDLMMQRGASEDALRELAILSEAAVGDRDRADLTALYWLADGSGAGAVHLGIPALRDLDPAALTPAQAAAASWLATIACRDGKAARRLARRAADPSREPIGLYSPRLALAITFTQTDDVLEALSVYEEMIADASAAGAGVPLALGLTGKAWVHLQRGRVEAAEDALAEAAASGPPDGRPSTVATSLRTIEIAAALTRGNLDAAQRAVDAAGDGGPLYSAPYLLFMRGLLELDLKRHRRALGLFQECGRRMNAAGWLNPGLVPWRSHVAIAAQALGDEHTAAAMISEEWRLAQNWGTRTAIGRTHLGAGVAVRSEDAVFRLTQAVNALQQSPARVLYVEALLLLAAAQLNRGQTSGVPRLLREAERLATAYRLAWATSRIADLGKRLSDRPRRSYRTASRRWRALSPAATDLVRRVLANASNAELAEELGVSKRAVELRLTAIYRQLEVTGRAELRELFDALDKEL